MNALIRCLGQAGISSPAEQFVTLGSLTPFLNGSSYLSVYRKILMQNVESVTNYCYPPETQQVLTQLLQEPSMLGKPIQWQSLALQRLDRLVSLFPERSLQSLNTAVLSSRWVLQIFSEENKWVTSPLGAACVQSESPAQRAAHTLRRRTLLRRSLIAQPSLRTSLPAPDCRTLRGVTASVWGTDILMKMSSIDFMDCLEDIGQDPDITSKELTSLMSRVLQISGPVSEIPPLMIARLGRLSTKLSESQLQQVLLADMQVMEALGREKEWTTKQLQILAQGFLRSNSLSVQDLDGVHLATLGHALCGLRSEDMEQLHAYEFCSAVLYLGSLPLQCTEQQLFILTRLCAHSDVFGPVSQWTEDIFREMGSVAAGLQDIELSSLVLEQIQGLSPLAVSLMPPKKFAVSFSALQLRMFSWSQAMGVTNQQWKLLDQEQQKSLNVILTGEENGTQDYRAGMSYAGHCSPCPLLFYCSLLLALCVIFLS
ncbi:stereocilin [Spea bombifrons]|uniref:stereocilin n=1 Tax=Spea bombifrons TaxID=233779 RepID=UPI00234A210B|nr:stereocilin [Spea bombifrons]